MSDYMVDETSGRLPISYKPIVVALHWLTALLIVVQVWLGFTFHELPRADPDRAMFFTWHKTVGVAILLLALIRLAVRLMNPPPPYPDTMPRWERAFAVWNHRAFYFLIIALPLTGLMAVSKRGATTTLVADIPFPTIPLPALGELHEPLVFATLGLLVLHVAGALKHQFFDKDATADRMPPFRSPR
jgi:cytochrome b561